MTASQEHAQPQAQQAQPPKGSGLSIAALIVAGLGLLLSWVPIINNVAFVFALIALALGIPAWLGARRGRRTGKGLAFASIVISVLAVASVLATQAFYGKVADEVSKSIDESFSELETDADKAFGESTDTVLAEDIDVSIGEFTAKEDEYGFVETSLVVTVTNQTEANISGEVIVAAQAADGSRIGEDHAFIDTLSPGQSAQIEIFQFVEEGKVEALKSATFEVVEASVY